MPLLTQSDSLAAAGHSGRHSSIQWWVAAGSNRVAEARARVIGYCVTEYTFFGQAFLTMLMVTANARGHGVGTRLLLDA